MKTTLNTIQKASEGKYTSKGSKFIGFSYPVNSIENIKHLHLNLKNEFPDATHVCYAYRIYSQDQIDEFNTDAGEPRGSAGLPILNSIKRNELINVGIFVLRYFGGSKLGIPGLIKAYGNAAGSAIDLSQVIKWQLHCQLRLLFDLEIYPRVISIIERFKGKVVTQEFQKNADLLIDIPETKKDEITKMLIDICSGKIKISNELS